MLTQSTKYLLIVIGVVVVFLIMLNSGTESSIPTPTPPSRNDPPSHNDLPSHNDPPARNDPPTRPPKTRPSVDPSNDINPLIVDPISKENVDFINNYLTQQQIDDALRKTGSVLTKHLESKQPVSTKTCTIVSYGSGNGEHTLCEINHANCAFLSFGINRDYSFDKQLVEEGCRGAGFDPSDLASGYQARLQKNLLFMAIGANSLDPVPSDWVMSSVPNLAHLFNMHKIAVLKMDCEGCEYALARDIIIEDPNFFNRVEQFAVEIHVGKFLMKTKEHLQNYGRLLHLLIEAGLELQDASLAPCSSEDEDKGCYPGLTETGYPCYKGIMCQNLLFARRV